MDPDVLLARAYLSRVAEPASRPLWDLVRTAGPVESVALIRSRRAPTAVLSATVARSSNVDPEADLDAAERHGIRLVAPESGEWPHFAFAALVGAARRHPGRDGIDPVPPPALWVKGPGDLAGAGVRSVAVVGSRAATAYGEHVTAGFAFGLARRSVVVVSGGAYGIDATAHRSALAAEGATILVSAAGLDRPYPPGNAALYERVGAEGLLVSESPPGAAPHRHRFLSRNRLIAALGAGTVVVEAARRSGALNTASHCAVVGRPVMAVPGPVTSAMSAGCHDLLSGTPPRAMLVSSVDDVLRVVGAVGEGTESAPTGSEASLDRLDPIARRVFDGFPARATAREDELARRSGIPIGDVLRALTVLRLAELVESVPEGHRIAPRARRRVR